MKVLTTMPVEILLPRLDKAWHFFGIRVVLFSATIEVEVPD